MCAGKHTAVDPRWDQQVPEWNALHLTQHLCVPTCQLLIRRSAVGASIWSATAAAEGVATGAGAGAVRFSATLQQRASDDTS